MFAGTPWDRPPTCDRCGLVESECRCPPLPPAEPARLAPSKQTARLVVEKRPGKRTMTVIRGLAVADNDLPALLAKLKAACGAGGTVVEDQLEIQGQHVERARTVLSGLGYKTKG
jgi:translation initiation factor 1